jgi:hypothetical protein
VRHCVDLIVEHVDQAREEVAGRLPRSMSRADLGYVNAHILLATRCGLTMGEAHI